MSIKAQSALALVETQYHGDAPIGPVKGGNRFEAALAPDGQVRERRRHNSVENSDSIWDFENHILDQYASHANETPVAWATRSVHGIWQKLYGHIRSEGTFDGQPSNVIEMWGSGKLVDREYTNSFFITASSHFNASTGLFLGGSIRTALIVTGPHQWSSKYVRVESIRLHDVVHDASRVNP